MAPKLLVSLIGSSLLAVAIAGSIAFKPASKTTANPEASSTTAVETASASSSVLDRASGRITYRTFDGHLVRVRLPGAEEISREPYVGGRADLTSADGEWRAHEACPADGGLCGVQLIAADGQTRALNVTVSLQWSRDVQWSPSGHMLAIRSSDSVGRSALSLIDDPSSARRYVVYGESGPGISAFAWTAGNTIIAATSELPLSRLIEIDHAGKTVERGSVADRVSYFYPSPDATQFAFTANDRDGWHLHFYDTTTHAIRDLGPMGAGGTVTPIPDVKTPMYIAWSPDGERLAFGGGLEPPYSMTIVNVIEGLSRRIDFAEGYPGEIKWTADSAQLAVSTYDPARTRHEVYVIDPATAASRHVISGCIIVWSPDGRFMAVHKEHEAGVVIVDVNTRAEAFLTHELADAIGWDE